jgi:hypothetical protein
VGRRPFIKLRGGDDADFDFEDAGWALHFGLPNSRNPKPSGARAVSGTIYDHDIRRENRAKGRIVCRLKVHLTNTSGGEIDASYSSDRGLNLGYNYDIRDKDGKLAVEVIHKGPLSLRKRASGKISQMSFKYSCRSLIFVSRCADCRINWARRSELIALTWADLNFLTMEILVTRSCVRNHFGDVKTETSRKRVPIHPPVRGGLLEWRKHTPFGTDGISCSLLFA